MDEIMTMGVILASYSFPPADENPPAGMINYYIYPMLLIQLNMSLNNNICIGLGDKKNKFGREWIVPGIRDNIRL